MIQVITGRTSGALIATAYAPLMGIGNFGTELYYVQVIPTAGTLSGLRVKLSAAPGSGKSWTASINLNGSPNLDVVISDANTTGVNTGSLTVAAGDLVTIKCVPAGSPTFPIVSYSVNFEGDTAGESIILGNTGTSTTQTRYGAAQGYGASSATEPPVKQIIPTPGVLKNLYVWLSADAGTAPDAYRMTLRQSGGSSALTCTVTADATTGSDTDAGHAVTVSAGDDVAMLIEPLNTPSVAPGSIGWGMVFVADTDGESLIMGGSSGDLVNSAVRYNDLPAVGVAWAASVTGFILNACTLKKFYVELTGTPYQNSVADDWYQFDVRLAAGNTGIVATVADGGTGNTVANDTTHTVDATDGQVLDLKCTPNSSPTVQDAAWGIVCYIAPEAQTYNESLTLAISADLSRTNILSAINSLVFAVVSGQSQSGGVTLEEALTLAISSGQVQAGSLSFTEIVTLAVNAIFVQSATTEINAGLSLGITADQGSGNVAEMDASIALALAAAILQSENVEGAPQTYDEMITIAAKMGMSRSAIGSLQEAITLATSESVGLTSQAIMVNALILQIVSSMDESFSVFVITTGNKLQFVFKKRKDYFTQ